MAMKKMYLANFNLTFGMKDDPLLKWLDELVLPAMNSGLVRSMSDKKTKIRFSDVKIEYIEDGELVLTGIIIKDTILDIYNEYDAKTEKLLDKDEHPKSAPYSIFVIYLKNHRMFLVKNQSGSPDIRLFTSSVENILKEYTKIENRNRKEQGIEMLPFAMLGIKGIKTAENIKEALKTVKKIKKFTIKIKPSNNELGIDMDDLLYGLDEEIRKVSASRTVNVVVPSPNSKEGVERIINRTNALAETELEVEYFNDDENIDSFTKKKSTGKISDSQMSQSMDVEVYGDLAASNEVLHKYCKKIESLHIETPNIKDYRNYIEKRKK